MLHRDGREVPKTTQMPPYRLPDLDLGLHPPPRPPHCEHELYRTPRRIKNKARSLHYWSISWGGAGRLPASQGRATLSQKTPQWKERERRRRRRGRRLIGRHYSEHNGDFGKFFQRTWRNNCLFGCRPERRVKSGRGVWLWKTLLRNGSWLLLGIQRRGRRWSSR